jgi:hypothetical protein
MDFSKLSSNEKMAVYASGVVGVLAIYSLATDWGALMILPLLGAVAVLVVVFLPQMSPATQLPGSKGSLLLIAGVVAAAFWLLAALSWLNYILGNLGVIDTLLFLLGLAASLWLAWTTWQAFQEEGGSFSIGMSSGGGTMGMGSTPPPPPPEPMGTPPPAPPARPPSDTDEEMR